MLHATRSILHTEGVRAFWKGNLAALCMVVPWGAVSFWAHQTTKRLLFQDTVHGAPTKSPWVSLCCGSVSGVTATIVTYPLDLLRTRLAVQSTNKAYTSLSHAFVTILSTHGVKGLYAGMWPTLIGIVPHMALNFTIYEALVAARFRHKEHQEKEEEEGGTAEQVGLRVVSPNEHFCFGFISGCASKLLTLPFDVVKKRTQVAGFEGLAVCSHGSSSVRTVGLMGPFALARGIVRAEGVAGLFRGWVPSLVKAGPTSALIFFTYDLAIRAFAYHFPSEKTAHPL